MDYYLGIDVGTLKVKSVLFAPPLMSVWLHPSITSFYLPTPAMQNKICKVFGSGWFIVLSRSVIRVAARSLTYL